MTERRIEVEYLNQKYTLNHYNSKVNQLRPESYGEDKEITETLDEGMYPIPCSCICIGRGTVFFNCCKMHP